MKISKNNFNWTRILRLDVETSMIVIASVLLLSLTSFYFVMNNEKIVDITSYASETPIIVDNGTCGINMTWAFDIEGTLTITGSGIMTDYTDKTNVPWYEYRFYIKKVVLSNRMTSIGDYAFNDCINSELAALPSGITSIGNNAFYNCNKITLSSLPSGITSIGNNAFYNCKNITLSSLPSGVTSIGDNAFYNCSEITLSSLPNGLTSIGNYTFCGCTNLNLTELPNGITTIGDSAFAMCEKINLTSLPSGITTIGQDAFYGCKNITLTSLPSRVTSIGNRAFSMCEKLALTSLPNGITRIGEFTFNQCKALSITSLPNGITSIGNYAFDGCSNLALSSLPSELLSIGEYAFYECINLRLTSLPSKLKTIGEESFAYCPNLTSLSIGNSITSIGTNAFLIDVHINTKIYTSNTIVKNYNWTGDARTVTFSTLIASGTDDNINWLLDNEGLLIINGNGIMKDYGVTSYPWYSYKDQILKVEFNSNVTNIGTNAFYDCTNLTNITIRNNIEGIGANAFYTSSSVSTSLNTSSTVATSYDWTGSNRTVSTTNLIASGTCGTSITWTLDYNGLLTLTGTGTMSTYTYTNRKTTTPWKEYNNYITELVMSDGITNIGQCAFIGCHNMKEARLSNDVLSIDRDAFYLCNSLQLTSLPSTVTIIKDFAFLGCYNISLTELPSGITSIGKNAFVDCHELALTSLPDAITKIENYTFNGCNKLTLTELPSGITSIGEYAFKECSNLALTTLPNGITSIGKEAFYECTKLTLTSLPSGITTILEGTFCGCTNLNLTELPSGITSIGDYAFSSCTKLALTSLPDSLLTIGEGAFASCGLQLTSLPSKLKTIGIIAFGMCDNISTLTIGNSVTSVGMMAFYSSKPTMLKLNTTNSVVLAYDWIASNKFGLFDINLEAVEDQAYNLPRTDLEAVDVVKDDNGTVLTKNTDYIARYIDLPDTNQVELIVIGKGKYHGLKHTIYNTLPMTEEAVVTAINNCTTDEEVGSVVFDLKVLEIVDPMSEIITELANSDVFKMVALSNYLFNAKNERNYTSVSQISSDMKTALRSDTFTRTYEETAGDFRANITADNYNKYMDYTLEKTIVDIELEPTTSQPYTFTTFLNDKDYYYLKSNNKGINNSKSDVIYTLTVPEETTLTIRYAVSSEAEADELRFYKNGVLLNSYSGDYDLETIDIYNVNNYIYTLSAGENVIKIEYAKNGSINERNDEAILIVPKELIKVQTSPVGTFTSGTYSVNPITETLNYRVKMKLKNSSFTLNEAYSDKIEVKKSIAVTFDSNGGNTISDKNVISGEKYRTLPVPTREGYLFGGWYLAESSNNGTGTRVTSETVVSNESNHTLYARWALVSNVNGVTYTGSQIRPSVTVTCGEIELEKDIDYEVTYGANINVVTPGSNDGSVTITGKGNYSGAVTKYFDIMPKPLTYIAVANDKEYDGSNTATITLSNLTGVESEDEGADKVSLSSSTISGRFETINVGENINVLLDESVASEKVTLSGTGAGNYSITQPTNLKADITLNTTAAITLNEGNFIYDGESHTITGVSMTPSGLELRYSYYASDGLTVINQSNIKDVGTYYVEASIVSGNYNVTPVRKKVSILPRELKLTGVTIEDKTYDKTESAVAVMTGAILSGLLVESEGILPNDLTGVALNSSSVSWSYANYNAGTEDATRTGNYRLTGTRAFNYELLPVNTPSTINGTINPKEIDVTIAGVNKEYDGNNTATVTIQVEDLADIISGDSVTFNYASATFDNANVGNNKTITVSGITSNNSNYEVSSTTGTTTANITELSGLTIPLATLSHNDTLTPVKNGSYGDTVYNGTKVTLSPDNAISHNVGASIYYAYGTNSNDSDNSDITNLYSIPLVINTNTTIRALARKTSYTDSSVGTYTYIVRTINHVLKDIEDLTSGNSNGIETILETPLERNLLETDLELKALLDDRYDVNYTETEQDLILTRIKNRLDEISNVKTFKKLLEEEMNVLDLEKAIEALPNPSDGNIEANLEAIENAMISFEKLTKDEKEKVLSELSEKLDRLSLIYDQMIEAKNYKNVYTSNTNSNEEIVLIGLLTKVDKTYVSNVLSIDVAKEEITHLNVVTDGLKPVLAYDINIVEKTSIDSMTSSEVPNGNIEKVLLKIKVPKTLENKNPEIHHLDNITSEISNSTKVEGQHIEFYDNTGYIVFETDSFSPFVVTTTDTVIVNVEATQNGSVTPSGTQYISKGGSVTLNILPDAGYEIDRVTVDGIKVNVANNRLVLSGIDADVIIRATFKSKETSIQGGGGAAGGNTTTTKIPEISGGSSNHTAYMSGYKDGTFKPKANITRGEMAVVLARYKGLNVIGNTSKFKDVQGKWLEGYVGALEEKGYVTGLSDGTYGVDRYITRAEACTMINNILERSPDKEKIKNLGEEINKFKDVETYRWYYADIMEATNGHLIALYN